MDAKTSELRVELIDSHSYFLDTSEGIWSIVDLIFQPSSSRGKVQNRQRFVKEMVA